MTYYTKFNTLFCEIILAGNETGLSNIHLNTGTGKRVFELSKDWIKNDDFFEETVKQINQYLSGKRKQFTVTLNPIGTDFQKRVWNELSKIPFGEVCSYKDIAIAIGSQNGARAVGMANSKNPLPLIVPCHRVIGESGKLTGFAHGLDIKEKLIRLENYYNNQEEKR